MPDSDRLRLIFPTHFCIFVFLAYTECDVIWLGSENGSFRMLWCICMNLSFVRFPHKLNQSLKMSRILSESGLQRKRSLRRIISGILSYLSRNGKENRASWPRRLSPAPGNRSFLSGLSELIKFGRREQQADKDSRGKFMNANT